jgi:hypothetical protein
VNIVRPAFPRGSAPILGILLVLSLLGFIAASRADDRCPTCGGTGIITCPDCGGTGISGYVTVNGLRAAYGCERCGGVRGNPVLGTGRPGRGTITCPTCRGAGKVPGKSPTPAPAAKAQDQPGPKVKPPAEADRKQADFEKAKAEVLENIKGVSEKELGISGIGETRVFGLDAVAAGGSAAGAAGSPAALREQADFDRMNSAWMTAQMRLISDRLAGPNPWCASVLRSLKIKEPPLPHKTFAELQPGDVLLVAPAEGLGMDALQSRGIRFVDRLSSWEWRSGASHTLIYLKTVNGKKLFLDNVSGQGPRIKAEEEILKEYGTRAMDIASPAELGVAQPLTNVEGDKLWAAARELGIRELSARERRSGNLVDTTGYGLYGDDNMVCSEVSRWALIKAGRPAPDSASPFKKLLGVYFGPANFYSQERYFLISPLTRPRRD